MPAPTNLSALTATDLGTLPASVTQNVHDAGTTYTVWFGPITVAETTIIRSHPFGALGGYEPRVTVFTGPASSPVNTGISSNANSPVQFRATSAEVYFLRILTNAGNPTPANLVLQVSAHIPVTVPAGSIVVPSDEFPYASILSPTVDHGILRFVDMSPGEAGDTLETGEILMEDILDSDVNVYQPDFALLTEIPFSTFTVGGSIRANWALNRFVAADPGNPNVVKIILSDGTVESTHALTGEPVNLRCCAISNDGSTLYWGRATAGIEDTGIVYRWDLNNDVALSDLCNHATEPAHVWEIVTLSDGTLLILFVAASGSTPLLVEVLHYQPDGTLLDTFDFTAEPDQWFPADAPPRIGRALDDPLSFWIRLHYDTGFTKFRNVLISDGSTISEVEYLDYLEGKYIAVETATPVADWGVSISCPFWITPVALGASASGEVGIIGPLVWVHKKRRE
jgi:WD40 repeat protein